jgi:hypothetical protein
LGAGTNEHDDLWAVKELEDVAWAKEHITESVVGASFSPDEVEKADTNVGVVCELHTSKVSWQAAAAPRVIIMQVKYSRRHQHQ